ncbi:MAG TPA: ABC transporter substrate binding protein [Casimicrobiaceae bacterium]|nr:ABC transporter substrate binding protein [Casimicrobiaceae bacterium]
MAYGPDLEAAFRRAAHFVDRLLKGAHVVDLPIERPSQFYLVVNARIARDLGVTIPRSVLHRADELLE